MTVNFIMQNVIILFIFTVLYIALYRWNDQFRKNRFYLIFIGLASILIPLLSFEVFGVEQVIENTNKQLSSTMMRVDNAFNYLSTIYYIGLGVSVLYLAVRLFRIYQMISATTFRQHDEHYINEGGGMSFSFLNYIFLEKNASGLILAHELVHVQQVHTLDKVIIEVCVCIMWFNPMVYVLRYLVNENQEFEADHMAYIGQNMDKVDFAQYLLRSYKSQAKVQFSIINKFHSLIKNRIKMLERKYVRPRFIYVLMIPIMIGVFSAFTFDTYPVYVDSKGEIIAPILISDTLRGKIVTSVDTVIFIDPNTMMEVQEIVRNIIPLDKYVKNIQLLGSTWDVIDTLIIMDAKDYSMTIEISETKIPMEYMNFWDGLSIEQQEDIIREYGSRKKTIEAYR